MFSLKIFFGYLDDCLVIFLNHEKIELFYQEINNIHTDIKFTYELEENGKYYSWMFLFKKETNHSFLVSTVYRKKTNIKLYTNWKSFIPFKYKINIIKSVIDRSYKICNSYQKKYTKNFKK